MAGVGSTIIFVCTSNTCRSPIAEQFAKQYLMSRSINDVRVVSRSLTTDYEPEDSPASEQGVTLLKETYDIDMSSHRSKMLSAEDVAQASVVRAF
jgi:protein-tyrosine-phosphatase